MAIVITLLSSFSFFIGYLIEKFTKDKKNLVIFSTSFSFIIILGLIVLDLLPECFENVSNKLFIILYALIGIAVLKVLDLFVPNHDHETFKHNKHLEHIGLISTIALILHNMVEGTAIYTSSLSSLSMGAMMALAVSFHNIPLGIQISSLIKDKKEKILMISLLALSGLLGVVLINLFKITLTEQILGVIISITLGMLIYISFFELLCEVKEHIKHKYTIFGLIFGILLVVIIYIIGLL